MWRALFLALGITLILVGGQLFFVEQLEIKRVRTPKPDAVAGQNPDTLFRQASYNEPAQTQPPNTFLVRPKDWMPWSLLAIGTIVVIYTFTIPGRQLSE